MSRPVDHGAASPERGAIIIHVAIALLALIVFSAFVVDYGVMWVARTQAQAVADSAALAGAISLSNGTTDELLAVQAFVDKNAVWGETVSPHTIVTESSVANPLPPLSQCSQPGCIRVDVMRGGADRTGRIHPNYLPTFFAQLVGITHQGVRATATAQAANGNAAKCVQPYIIPDKWLDTADSPPGWTQTDVFSPPAGDSYIPPSQANTTGFTLANKGMQLLLKTSTGNWGSGWTQIIDFGLGGGASVLPGEISCMEAIPQEVGLYDPTFPCVKNGATDPTRGCLSIKTGVNQGPIVTGIGDLLSQDSGAHWQSGQVVGSAYDTSPRIVPVAVFNTQAYYTEDPSGCNGTGCVAQVANIFGFFVEGMCNSVTLDPGVSCGSPSQANKTVVGRIMALPGESLAGAGSNNNNASFIKIVRLVQ